MSEKRDDYVMVRMSKEEKSMLKKCALENGMTMGAYIRYKLLYEGR